MASHTDGSRRGKPKSGGPRRENITFPGSMKAGAARPRSGKIQSRPRLGEILVLAGKLNEEHLALALDVQKRTGQRLGEVLHQGGHVRAEDVAKALSLQYGLAYLEPATVTPESVDLTALAKLTMAKARSGGILPINVSTSKYLVIGDILATKVSDEALALIGERREFAVTTQAAILTAIEGLTYQTVDTAELVESVDRTIEGGEINELLSYLLGRAVLSLASDIHIEPLGHSTVVRFRIDGELRSVITLPRHRHENLVNVLFGKSGIDMSDFQRLQDGRFSFEFGARNLDVRFACSPTVEGPAVVMRILDDKRSLVTLEELGYASWNYKAISNLAKHPHGVILVVGPTGSGKTTTLYSILNSLNTGDRKILTVEDPVEIKVPSVQQVRVNVKAGVTFASAVRGFLRQDPDIILVGEIRDEETARETFRAANTGHLVFSTLHANSACESVGRLLDLGLDSYVVSSALLGVVSQRLVRALCKECREPIDRRKQKLDSDDRTVAQIKGRPHRPGPGCSSCQGGFSGRAVVAEVLEVSDSLRRLIHEKRPVIELVASARKEGFLQMAHNAVALLEDGTTSLGAAERVVGPLEDFIGPWGGDDTPRRDTERVGDFAQAARAAEEEAGSDDAA